jgi:hypothetical protein
MKNKLLSLASLLAVFNANAIEIGPTGSGIEMSGFIDLAFTDQATGAQSTAVGQVEVNFDYSKGPVSASIDLDFGGGAKYSGLGNPADPTDDSYDGNLEEAVITYDFGNGFSVSAGKMLSYMGFEAFDPTNMYQYSYAYDSGNNAVQSIYDAYDVGVSVDYATDDYSIGVWSSAENSAGYELALAYTGVENLTVKAIWSDFSDQAGGPAYEKSTFWASYQLGKLLIAAEVAEADLLDGGNDVEGALIMANYAITDKVGLTLRYSTEEISAFNSDVLANEYNKFTVSPSYVFTDSLSGLIEYSTYQDDVVGNTNPEDLLAAELIFTF